MSPQRIGGIILLVIGVVLLFMGINASDSIADQFSEFFTGHFTDTTVWYILGGIVALVVGAILMMGGGRRALS